MSNTIQFLADLGAGRLSSTADFDLRTAAAAYGLDTPIIDALVSGDASRLSDQLGGRAKMICALFPAEPEQEPTPEGDEPADAPEQAPDEQIGFSRH